MKQTNILFNIHMFIYIECLKSSLFSLCWKWRNLISLYLHRVVNSRIPEIRISWISTKLVLVVIQPWRSWSITQSFKVLVKVSPIDDWINTAVEDGSEEENIRDIFGDLKTFYEVSLKTKAELTVSLECSSSILLKQVGY